ncbi:MAG: hypothetical protein QG635_994 [Bacteroidota bacterium]|nr:hypothetical protein [Bacteroidota bacterium]
MASLILDTFSDNFHLLPMTGLIISYSEDSDYTGEYTKLFNIEAESSWRLEPVKRMTSKGYEITLGYKLTASIYVPQNDYLTGIQSGGIFTRIEDTIQEISEGIRPNLFITLGEQSEDCPTNIINSNSAMGIDCGQDCSFTYLIEQVEFRPRMIINITGFIKDPMTSRISGETPAPIFSS